MIYCMYNYTSMLIYNILYALYICVYIIYIYIYIIIYNYIYTCMYVYGSSGGVWIHVHVIVNRN